MTQNITTPFVMESVNTKFPNKNNIEDKQSKTTCVLYASPRIKVG